MIVMMKILITFIFIAGSYLLSTLVFETISKKYKVQRILLELGFGILLGSTSLLVLVDNSYLNTFAILGAVVLLFTVGYGSKLSHLIKEKQNITILATVGVIIPFVTVYLSCYLFQIPMTAALFIAAAGVSTSVGISARILYESHKCNSDIGTIILGASVLDDIYGLAILSALIAFFYKDGGNLPLVFVSLLIFAFILLISFYTKKIAVEKMRNRRAVLAVLAPIVISLPFVAGYLSLTPITGAYFAGLLSSGELNERFLKIQKQIYSIVVPIFFIYTGTRISLQTLFTPNVLLLGFALFVAVLVGQLLAGLSLAPFLGLYHGLLTGFGMLPRGEVSMYIAVTALGMGVITREHLGAIVIMILLCAIVVSALLKKLVRGTCKV